MDIDRLFDVLMTKPTERWLPPPILALPLSHTQAEQRIKQLEEQLANAAQENKLLRSEMALDRQVEAAERRARAAVAAGKDGDVADVCALPDGKASFADRNRILMEKLQAANDEIREKTQTLAFQAQVATAREAAFAEEKAGKVKLVATLLLLLEKFPGILNGAGVDVPEVRESPQPDVVTCDAACNTESVDALMMKNPALPAPIDRRISLNTSANVRTVGSPHLILYLSCFCACVHVYMCLYVCVCVNVVCLCFYWRLLSYICVFAAFHVALGVPVTISITGHTSGNRCGHAGSGRSRSDSDVLHACSCRQIRTPSALC